MGRTEHNTAKLAEVRFGEYRLVRTEQRLWRGTEPVRLDPKTWDLLDYLVDHPDEVLARSTLLAEVWPDVVVSEDALTKAVHRLRTALGDDARTPQYIETVHRRGFRFLATPPGSESTRRTAEEARTGHFVGRQNELATLTDAAVAAEDGARQMAIVAGDAGIGKTTLLEQLIASLPLRWRIVRAQCIEQFETPEPYLPLLNAFEQMAQSEPHDDLVTLLRRFAPSWLAQMPWLVDEDEARALREQLSVGTRPRMNREMAAALEAWANDRPLLLAIEDLHGCDPATLDLLNVMAQRTTAIRFLVVITMRANQAAGDGHPSLALTRDLVAKGRARTLSLEALDLDSIRTLVRQRFPASHANPDLAQWVFQQTDGNPLYVKSILDHMVASGWFVEGERGWQISPSFDPSHPNSIPPDLRQMIGTVLDAVAANDREMLEAASVAGETFECASIAAALEGDEAAMEAAETSCRRLARGHRLIRSVGPVTWPDGTHSERYAFRHALYRTVLYEGIPASRRRRWHQAVGERLEGAYRKRLMSIAPTLAHHFEAGGDSLRTVQYKRTAAYGARLRFADDESDAYLASALQHLPDLDPSPARDRWEINLRANRSVLRVVKRGAAFAADEDANLDRAEALLRDLPDEPSTFGLVREVWLAEMMRCRPDRYGPLVDRIERLADLSQRDTHLADAALAKGIRALHRGYLPDACTAFAAGRDVCRRGFEARSSDRTEGTRWRSRALGILTFDLWARMLSGRLAAGAATIRDAIELDAAGPVHPYMVAALRFIASGTAALVGDFPTATRHLTAATELAEENRFVDLLGGLRILDLWCRLETGDAATSDVDPEQLRTWAAAIDASSFHPTTRLYSVYVYTRMGAANEGLALLGQLQRDCAGRGVRWFDSEMERTHAELVVQRDGPAAIAGAATALRRAVRQACAQGATLLALRSAITLVELCPADTAARRRLRNLSSELDTESTMPLQQRAEALLER